MDSSCTTIRKPTTEAMVRRCCHARAILQEAPRKSVIQNMFFPAPRVNGAIRVARPTASKVMPCIAWLPQVLYVEIVFLVTTFTALLVTAVIVAFAVMLVLMLVVLVIAAAGPRLGEAFLHDRDEQPLVHAGTCRFASAETHRTDSPDCLKMAATRTPRAFIRSSKHT